MTATRTQKVFASLGLVITLVLTVLGIYTAVRANDLSLPTGTFSMLLSIVLPILTILNLMFHESMTRKGTILRFISPSASLTILSLLDTVLITLAATTIQPDYLKCALEDRWQDLFQSKKAQAIKSIQEALNCCGLSSSRDRAWPFPDRSHDATSCRETYSRDQGCKAPWTGQFKIILGIWIVVGASGLLMKGLYVVLRQEAPRRMIQEHLRQARNPMHRSLTQGEPDGERYTDEPPEEQNPSPRDLADIEEGRNH